MVPREQWSDGFGLGGDRGGDVVGIRGAEDEGQPIRSCGDEDKASHREEEGKRGEKGRPSQQLRRKAESGDDKRSLRADSNKLDWSWGSCGDGSGGDDGMVVVVVNPTSERICSLCR